MSIGATTLNTSQKREPQNGPPFVATAADNGLSVDPGTGRIVLGNDVGGSAAGLLSIRDIELNGFEVDFLGTTVGPNRTRVSIQDGFTEYDCIGSTGVLGGIFITDLEGSNGNQANFLYNSLSGLLINWPTIPPDNNSCTMTGGSLAVNLQTGDFVGQPAIQFLIGQDYSGGGVTDYGIRLSAAYNSAVGTPNIFALDLSDALSAAGALFSRYSRNGVNQITIDKFGNIVSLGSLQTGDPGSGTATWKLGQVVAGVVAPDAANYVEVEINGVVVKLIKAA